MGLTPRQLEVATFIHRYISESGISPTLDEIAESLNVCKITVYEHVSALVKKGVLSKEKYKARSLRLVDGWQAAGGECILPVLGAVCARSADSRRRKPRGATAARPS